MHSFAVKRSGAGSARLSERMVKSAPREAFTQVRGTGDPFGELKVRVQRACISKLGPRIFGGARDSRDFDAQVTQIVTEEIEKEETPLSDADRERLIRELTADILGYGPIEPYLDDPSVTEIMVNGYDGIYVERDGEIEPTDGRVRRRGSPAADHRQDRRRRSAGASTRRRRWSTPGCRTAPA